MDSEVGWVFGSSDSLGQSSVSSFRNLSDVSHIQPSATSLSGVQTASFSFGGTPTGLFGATQPSSQPSATSLFGVQTAGFSFGGTPTGLFGATQPSSHIASTPAFRKLPKKETPAFRFSYTPVFGSYANGLSSTPEFGSDANGDSKRIFGNFGFGTSSIGSQPGGSRVAPYAPTFDAEGCTSFQPAGKVESISANHVYKSKSHEELRWEDYQRGDKGSVNPAIQPGSRVGIFATLGHTSGRPTTTHANPFACKPLGSTGFGASSDFDSWRFGSSPSPSGSGSFHFGSKTIFGNVGFSTSAIDNQPRGSRVAPYAPTFEEEGDTSFQPVGKVESISANHIYKESHEELRWEDYQRGDKGSVNPTNLTSSHQECCICLTEYEEGAELQSLPCNHHFHASCISKWLQKKAMCPL